MMLVNRITNWEEYMTYASRTCASLNTRELNLTHMITGIVTETYELLDAPDRVNVSEEIADKFWYIANLIRLEHLDVYVDINNIQKESQYLVRSLGIVYTQNSINKHIHTLDEKLLDGLKKFIAYGKPFEESLDQLIQDYILTLVVMVELWQLDLVQILTNNINKLYVRFGDKFDADKAINRDTDAERDVLDN
jgi:NTP pyrophosphatase (non-canonical NTP hydrolase)